ncbi:DUF397 domain-containing protein [Amycolatopsis balhimycina DSM 5908]|uniref:DUF397 domain-containing protein n=1 Tax=Amycolatopsis balhimycina DSM 5908 TaxID=1081091 RepID=A0A428VYI3_AMYBA|nr:DUF397 domain-containing protein [Amycolatopsis balhimycina]RSM35879.1 DUF397 domain-containing protein [Amycolatopsis balhimycina DSM 5908]
MTAATFREQDFRKASASNPDKDCVRVARQGSRVELRDDKNVFGSSEDVRLRFTDAEFDEILTALRSTGTAAGTCLEITQTVDAFEFRRTGERAALVFTASEMDKFLIGVRDGEFEALAFAV